MSRKAILLIVKGAIPYFWDSPFFVPTHRSETGSEQNSLVYGIMRLTL